MTLLAVLALFPAPVPVSRLDALAQARDVAGIRKLVTVPAGVSDPFGVIKSNGAYDCGRFGWHAYEMKSPDGTQYVVFGTPLTSEDIGELVLRREGEGLRYVPESDPLGVRLLHHRFDLKFDVAQKRADLVDKLTFRSSGKGSFLFRMSPAYRVAKVTDAAGQAVPFTQASGVVAVPKPGAKEATYTIEYGGVVNLPQYAGSISEREATLVNDYWYPMVSRQPTSYEIAIRGPKDWTSVAQGHAVPSNDGSVKYKMDLPVVYFSVLSAPFKSVDVVIHGRHYRTWSTRLETPALKRQSELSAPIVEFYAKTFGQWPFDGYGVVDSRQYGGGALEAYSFATWGGGVPAEDAHEPAHTLWGGVINNTYLNSFWNESFAVFSDGLYHRNVPIGDVAERRLAFIHDGNGSPEYNLAPMAKSGADIGPVASSLGYGKGGQVLQMLEEWLGTKEVIGCMRTWLETHPKGEPGNWEDFERVVAKRNPKHEIKGFFDDWVRRPGYANFDAAASTASYSNGATKINLKWKGPSFRMPITVLLRDTDGTDRYETLFFGANSKEIVIEGPKPALVSVDPWRQALRTVAPDEAPVSLDSALRGLPKLVDPKHPDWMSFVGGRGTVPSGTVDPAGKFLVGSPESWPLMGDLCAKAGFVVAGDRLAYKGTVIDLREGCAVAVVDLGGGKRCVIGLGKTEQRPDFGRARLAVTDRLGRFLRGATEPKTRGSLTFRL